MLAHFVIEGFPKLKIHIVAGKKVKQNYGNYLKQKYVPDELSTQVLP